MDERQAILALLQDPTLQLSYAEIWQMMDEELGKPIEEVDLEFVQDCIEALLEKRERAGYSNRVPDTVKMPVAFLR